jgi:hypothetical protein
MRLMQPVKRQRRQTIASIAQGKLGVWKGARCVAFMVCWEQTRRELGREPTLEEYMEVWNVSRATAFREQREFRLAFPGNATPSSVFDSVAVPAVLTPRTLGGVAFA